MFGCFFGHKWNKWKIVKRDYVLYSKKFGWDGEYYKVSEPYLKTFQVRDCQLCGHTQEKEM